MNLQRCLLNSGLVKPDRDEIIAAAAMYEKRGKSGKDAALQAIQDKIDILKKDEAAILKQVSDAFLEKNPDFALKAETEAEIKAREDAQKAADKAQAEADRKAAEKEQADRERDNFNLTGSDRPADSNPDQAPLFSRVNPIWRSALSDAVAAMKMNTAPAAQWKATLKNQPGVKPDELEWSGLNEWLDMQRGKVTKEQVLDYLAENGVQVTETVLGDGQRERYIRELNAKKMQELRDMADDLDIDWADLPNTKPALVEAIVEAQEDEMGFDQQRPAGAAKFEKYTLPGGENYRELLLTLPEKDQRPSFEDWTAKYHGGGDWQVFDREGNARGNVRLAHDAPAETVFNAWWHGPAGHAARKLSGVGMNFRSSHFDQPNILAHIRFNERTDADGKRVLFIEEIQSDFGQSTKKQKDAIARAVDQDFQGIVDKMKASGVLAVECD